MRDEINLIEAHIANQPIEQAIAFFTNRFPDEVKFSSAFGQEDQVITDLIFKNKLQVEVFTLDTGRLFLRPMS